MTLILVADVTYDADARLRRGTNTHFIEQLRTTRITERQVIKL